MIGDSDGRYEPPDRGKIIITDEVNMEFSGNGKSDETGGIEKIIKQKNKYSSTDQGPYYVFVQSKEGNIGKFHKISTARLILNAEPEIRDNILNISVTGRNKVKVELNSFNSANKLVESKVFQEKNYEAYIPTFFTYKKSVIKSIDKDIKDDDLLNIIKPKYGNNFKVYEVRRIKRKVNGELLPTMAVIVTFKGQMIPKQVVIEKIIYDVEIYVPRVIQCRQCMRYGHVSAQCRGNVRCGKCGNEHETNSCNSQLTSCILCRGSHEATDRKNCEEFHRQKQIKTYMATENLSYSEANKKYDHSYATVTKNVNKSTHYSVPVKRRRNLEGYPNYPRSGYSFEHKEILSSPSTSSQPRFVRRCFYVVRLYKNKIIYIMRPGAKKSVVWEYFIKNENQTGTCKLCKKIIKCFGGTTNLRQHLLRIHPTQMLENEPPANTEINQNVENIMQPEVENTNKLAVPGTSGTNLKRANEGMSKDTRPQKQLKLFGVKKVHELSESDLNKLDVKLLKLITHDYQPLSIVEDKGFIEYSRALQPLYKLPSRKKLTYEILPKYYTESASTLKITLSKVENIAVTTDIWTSDSNVAYITVTAHFTHESNLCARVLCTKGMSGSHTSEKIADELTSIFNDWNIGNKIITVVSDNGANIKKAITHNLQKHHHPCVAHTLNLSVSEAILKNDSLSSVLTKCRALVGYFKHSVVASDRLKTIQMQMGLTILKVKQDVSTRWNSCYIMLQRLINIKDSLSIVVTDLPKSPQFLNAEEWKIIVDCVKVLKPANDITTIVSSERYPTMSLIVPLIRGLQYALVNIHTETEVGQTLKTTLLDVVSRRLGHLEKNKIVAKATFLDPRFKKVVFGSEENSTNAQTWVTEELNQRIAERKAVSDQEVSPQPQHSSDVEEISIWTQFDKKMAEKKICSTPTSIGILMIRQYLELPAVDRKNNPLNFWVKHKEVLPELYDLAIKYLCVPATSVPSERVFSKTGQITNLRRNRLAPKNLDQIIFLNSCEL
ncbi:unnamed protein product [Diabrotica balteata]|uniref:BED-type domain-containing protein n=1 Tax=Diabrotica balteata TaxID=107213 RepID=A0A9N9XBV0_DIABA|nr:unnamed protein product [Diabrotica balteata]